MLTFIKINTEMKHLSMLMNFAKEMNYWQNTNTQSEIEYSLQF
jgi:hypothetical protein